MQNDTELLKGISAGDKEAFETIYDHYAPVVYGLALRVTESRDKAAKVVQAVFQKLWQTAPTYDPSQKDAFFWITDMAKNVAIENESRSEQFDFFAFQHSNSTGYNLQEVLSKIDSKHRQVVELSYFRNLTEDQIEEEMNIPVGTVATRLRLAIKALREIVG